MIFGLKAYTLMLCLISLSLTAVAGPAFGNSNKVIQSPDGSNVPAFADTDAFCTYLQGKSRGGSASLQPGSAVTQVGQVSYTTCNGTRWTLVQVRNNADGKLWYVLRGNVSDPEDHGEFA